MRKDSSLFDFVAEILRKIPAQARQLDGVAQRHDPPDLVGPIEIREITDRPLQFRQEIVEDGLHRLKHRLRIGRRRRIPLEMLGLGERQLQLAASALVKWVPPRGIGRCQTRYPLVITKSVASVPMAMITVDSGGLSASYSSGGGKSVN